MSRLGDATYNERLFGRGLRGRLHSARFRALGSAVRRRSMPAARVVELGCYDGKTIRFLPRVPERYLGLDANWEGGLDLGRAAWAGHPGIEFRYCATPADVPEDERFDLAICMETLEHVPAADVDAYLARLAAITDGHVFVTVPTEKGIVFALKYLAKKLVIGDAPPYTVTEFVNASLGRTQRVPRDEHKGFDFESVVAAVARHFDVLTVEPLPLPWLPRSLGFGVAILGRSRPAQRLVATSTEAGAAAAGR